MSVSLPHGVFPATERVESAMLSYYPLGVKSARLTVQEFMISRQFQRMVSEN